MLYGTSVMGGSHHDGRFEWWEEQLRDTSYDIALLKVCGRFCKVELIGWRRQSAYFFFLAVTTCSALTCARRPATSDWRREMRGSSGSDCTVLALRAARSGCTAQNGSSAWCSCCFRSAFARFTSTPVLIDASFSSSVAVRLVRAPEMAPQHKRFRPDVNWGVPLWTPPMLLGTPVAKLVFSRWP
jgi:hypothetical protein